MDDAFTGCLASHIELTNQVVKKTRLAGMQEVGKHDDLTHDNLTHDDVTTVKKRKLKWQQPHNQRAAEAILQGTVQGRSQGRQKRMCETDISDWTDLKPTDTSLRLQLF